MPDDSDHLHTLYDFQHFPLLLLDSSSQELFDGYDRHEVKFTVLCSLHDDFVSGWLYCVVTDSHNALGMHLLIEWVVVNDRPSYFNSMFLKQLYLS